MPSAHDDADAPPSADATAVHSHSRGGEDHGGAKHDELSAPTTLDHQHSDEGFHRSLGTINTGKSSSKHPVPTTSAPARPPMLKEDSFKRISHAPVPFGSLSEAFAYAVFLVLFVLATTILDHDARAFFFSNRLRAALVERDFAVGLASGNVLNAATTTQKRFVGVQTQGEVWTFLQGPLLDTIYGSSVPGDSDDGSGAELPGMVLSYNRLLGGVRLRTVRVKPDTCAALTRIPEYSAIVPYCYGTFSTHNEQTQGYGPILNSPELTATLGFRWAKAFFADRVNTKVYADLLTCNSDCPRSCGERFGVERYRYVSECANACEIHCKCLYEQPVGFDLCGDPNPDGPNAAPPTPIYAYNWSAATMTQAGPVVAYTAAYPGSGYVVDLSLNGTAAAMRLAELREQRYLDLATRALVIDFTVYNAYLQLFSLVQLVLEFPPSGGVFASFSDEVVRIFRYSTPRHTARIVLELLLVTFVTWRWKSMLQWWYRHGGIRAYLRAEPFWHGLHLLHLTMFAVVIGFRLFVIDLTYGTLSGRVAGALAGASLESIPTFRALAQIEYVDAILGSLNTALVWLQFLKYTQMSKRMCLLIRMLRRAGPDLGWFFVYFLTCICAFGQVGFLLFGLQLAGFRTLGAAIVTLLQGIAGELDYAAMAEIHAVVGPLFYIAFYLLLLLILVNVFLAILNDAYVQSITEQEEEDEAEEAALLRSMGAGASATESGDPNANIEAQLRRLERRELEQLRKYPFSRGLRPAIRLLLADLKHTLYEFRTGRRLFKVDPMVSGMIGVAGSTAAAGVGSRVPIASRKLTLQVRKQLERQLQLQEAAREIERREQAQAHKAMIEAQQNELAERLSTLVESNRDKTTRLAEMEGTLGSIERLCQQLVTAALEDLPGSPKRPTTTAAGRSLHSRGGAITSAGSGVTALALALQRQKTSGKLKAGDEIEEITL